MEKFDKILIFFVAFVTEGFLLLSILSTGNNVAVQSLKNEVDKYGIHEVVVEDKFKESRAVGIFPKTDYFIRISESGQIHDIWVPFSNYNKIEIGDVVFVTNSQSPSYVPPTIAK